MPISRTTRAHLAVAGALVGASTLLAGCGGSGSATTTVAGAAPTASASGTGRGPGAGMDAATQASIQQCLTAAGLTMPSFTRRPGASGARPSGSPGGTPPAGTRGGVRPSGAPGGGPFADPKIQAALTACGITLPTGRPPAGAPSPSAS